MSSTAKSDSWGSTQWYVLVITILLVIIIIGITILIIYEINPERDCESFFPPKPGQKTVFPKNVTISEQDTGLKLGVFTQFFLNDLNNDQNTWNLSGTCVDDQFHISNSLPYGDNGYLAIVDGDLTLLDDMKSDESLWEILYTVVFNRYTITNVSSGLFLSWNQSTNLAWATSDLNTYWTLNKVCAAVPEIIEIEKKYVLSFLVDLGPAKIASSGDSLGSDSILITTIGNSEPLPNHSQTRMVACLDSTSQISKFNFIPDGENWKIFFTFNEVEYQLIVFEKNNGNLVLKGVEDANSLPNNHLKTWNIDQTAEYLKFQPYSTNESKNHFVLGVKNDCIITIKDIQEFNPFTDFIVATIVK
jgi:hypothetical protein